MNVSLWCTLHIICDYKKIFLDCLRWSFLIKAKCHHALLGREFKSINTSFLFFFSSFSSKKAADHWIHSTFIRSGHFFSLCLDGWLLQTQYHIYVSTCGPWFRRTVCSLFWTVSRTQLPWVLLIYCFRKTSNNVTRISQVKYQAHSIYVQLYCNWLCCSGFFKVGW